ncbi:dynamin family protein [Neobacillus muris]|uniref:dynamin family protein n=1 Tax=Neobacillus muris TaxID=2941334 RepID=UPI00204041C4|nr:dynamin family protein [Neobacillus muris]
MVKTVKSDETVETLKQKLVSVYDYLIMQKDIGHAEKVKQLANKFTNQEFTVAFCGHFSAGKSTMINRVVGENLLPSSPIPTSANLVKVKSGDEYAKVFFKNEKPRLYLAPYDYELVKNYCKDGDKIQEIEISHSGSVLPPGTIIMDTPGIDSADDAHRVATESALHLADLIFYVMDYNHVQAELNFFFTKELMEAGKDVYLVINQIDKHSEEELSFSEFQISVRDSFASWGVKPAKIFYTSLREKDHPHNQFAELQSFILEQLDRSQYLLLPSLFHSLEKIARDHLEQIRKQEEEDLLPYFELVSERSIEEKIAIEQTYKELSAQLKSEQEGTLAKEEAFDRELEKLLSNAYLMPFQTRKLAESYLESCQPEFKVGFLFSKQKTHEEKENRLSLFYQDILEKTKSQLEWHIRELLIRTLKETGIQNGEAQQLAQTYSIPVSVDLLQNAVKQGARLSGQYLLQYTDDVANEIKKAARNQSAPFRTCFAASLKQRNEQLIQRYQREIQDIEKYITAFSRIREFKNRMAEKERKIEEFLSEEKFLKTSSHWLFNQEREEFEIVRTQGLPEEWGKSNGQNQVIAARQKQQALKAIPEARDVKKTSARLRKASQLIEELPGFQKLAGELTEKAARLENKGFTVALFGAFSAGKSSFANALMGDKVLPVSPNPTTAAINKIRPVTTRYGHGTVRIKFKDRAAMFEDINRSLKVFDLRADDFTQALSKINQVFKETEQENALEKTHYAFLRAFKLGYDALINQLGTILETDISEFNEYVVKEEKSCYVEWIELYYDCELTRKGITLVDTPGADSINARHTGVSFDYIKNSDAILFVTYYNHAFSRADREFLIQLGRVKESFQLDKMFFIINAIDLAESEEEKEAVVQYVMGQLTQYGIRNPHLYTVSSLQALNEKRNPGPETISGISLFEQGFYQFISNELTEMAISAAENELQRVREMVNRLIQSSQQDKTEREEKQQEYHHQLSTIQDIFEKQKISPLQIRMAQEAEELVFYIKQRVFFRFNDFFKEAFNPAVLKNDGRSIKKALHAALEEFLESIGFDFAQEMRATTVRLERFLEKLLQEYQISLQQMINQINPDISFSAYEKRAGKEIDFPMAFKDTTQQDFTKALAYFKNPKAFFEKDEKKLMSTELYSQIDPMADVYLSQESSRLMEHYKEYLTNEYTLLLQEMSEQVKDYFDSLLAALEGGLSIDRLAAIKQKLEEVDELDCEKE